MSGIHGDVAQQAGNGEQVSGGGRREQRVCVGLRLDAGLVHLAGEDQVGSKRARTGGGARMTGGWGVVRRGERGGRCRCENLHCWCGPLEAKDHLGNSWGARGEDGPSDGGPTGRVRGVFLAYGSMIWCTNTVVAARSSQAWAHCEGEGQGG